MQPIISMAYKKNIKFSIQFSNYVSRTKGYKKMKWIMITGIVCMFAMGCFTDIDKDVDSNILDGTKWSLIGAAVSSVDLAQFTITAQFSTSQISGNSGINTYGGSYTIGANNTFSVGALHSTKMGGSEEAMRAENLFIELLQKARKYEVKETTLTLKNESGNQILLEFTAQ